MPIGWQTKNKGKLTMTTYKKIGVVIVTFNSSDIVTECLESLFASRAVALSVVVVDNNSTDGTVETVRDWASGRLPFTSRANCPIGNIGTVAKPVQYVEQRTDGVFPATHDGLTLLRSPTNGGFAFGVNCGLRALLPLPEIDLFWVLNPDCIVHPQTASIYLEQGKLGNFSLMGCRTIYYEQPDQIQTQGGHVSKWTATCSQDGYSLSPRSTPLPNSSDLDFVTGANMVASRRFIEQSGLMVEDYFLYYEEVDWAFRRGTLPLLIVPSAIVYHHGGTSIGTGSTTRRPSPFANYFNYRNRIKFARRHLRGRIPIVYLYAMAKAAQLLLKWAPSESWAIIAGIFNLRPPREILARISDPVARQLAFGRAEP